jgi:catechol 2,3-dioxygenase-like lactoylglutathione lyase family enzyme
MAAVTCPAIPDGPARLDHVTIAAADLDASLRLYDAALAALGLQRQHELRDEEEDDAAVDAVGYGGADGGALLWLVAAGASPTRSVHVSLRAGSRAAVQRFHDAAVAAGAASHDAPRRWPLYRRGDYNAIVQDPDGNLIEAVADE